MIKIKQLALLSALPLLMGVACSRPKENIWVMQATSPEGFDSLHRVEKELFISKGKAKHKLEFFLRHDNRTLDESIPLRIEIQNKQEEIIHRDSLLLPLAEHKGLWIGQGLLSHELSFEAPKQLYLNQAGIYKVIIYSPQNPAPKGITLVGFRLKR